MVKLSKMLLVALVAVLLVVPGLPMVAATDSDDDGIEDELEHVNERDLSVDVQTGEITVQSVLRTGDTKNEIEFSIKNESEGLRIKLHYHTETNSTAIELEFSIEFRALIEFVDNDLNGIYNDSTDTEVQTVPLDAFNNVVHTTSNIANDTILHYFKIGTTDGKFIAHVYVPEEFVLVNNTIVTPVELKIAIEINFSYLNPHSKLALDVKLESETGYEDETQTHDESEGHSSGEQGVSTTINNTAAFFSWEETALVDGVAKPVLRSPRSDDSGDEKIYLNYPNGTNIYHDPKIGIALPTILLGGGIPFTDMSLLFAAISFIAVTVWLAKRRAPAKI